MSKTPTTRGRVAVMREMVLLNRMREKLNNRAARREWTADERSDYARLTLAYQSLAWVLRDNAASASSCVVLAPAKGA